MAPAHASLVLARLRHAGDAGQPLVPTRYQAAHRPVRRLLELADRRPIRPAVRCLQLAGDRSQPRSWPTGHAAGEDPVEVYVLNDRKAFTHFLKFYYPELPPRRAFFLAQGTGGSSTRTSATGSRKTCATRRPTPCCAGRRRPAALARRGPGRVLRRDPTPDAQDEHLAKLPEDLKRAGRPTFPAWSH